MGSKIHVCEHSSPCHPEIQVKGLSGKEEAISEYNLQTLLPPLDYRLFKMDQGKVENCSTKL